MTLTEWMDGLKPENAKGFLNQGHESRDLERLRRMAERLEDMAAFLGVDVLIQETPATGEKKD